MRDVELDKELAAYTSWKDKHGGFAKDMTLRDYFASRVLQGVCATLVAGDNPDAIPAFAYELADLMLEARK